MDRINLIERHKRLIKSYTLERKYPSELKKLIINFYDQTVTEDNVLRLYVHPLGIFIKHLVNNTLDELLNSTHN